LAEYIAKESVAQEKRIVHPGSMLLGNMHSVKAWLDLPLQHMGVARPSSFPHTKNFFPPQNRPKIVFD
jgi:hypothetical protein